MSERGRLPDQKARDRIERDLGVNLLVEAGAGSGKTESLARRMAAGIAEGRYEVEGIAAVTFTRKAAAELRGRFQLGLERRLREDTDPVRKDRIQRALSQLERLFAGTIHAFCAHLLRERPVEAGVAPGFTEQDDVDDAAFRAHAWRDYLDRERAHSSQTLHELEEAGLQPADLDDAFKLMCTFGDVDFPPGEGQPPATEPVWKELDRFWKELAAPVPAFDPDTSCKVQRAARRCQRLLRVADRRRPSALVDVLDCWESAPKITQNRWPGTSKERKAIRDRVEGLINAFREETLLPFLAARRQYVYRLAVTLLTGGRAFAAEARSRAVTLNYGDLLMVAARLLRDNPEVRAALQRKYRWLFVDEFQDTNPLQAEVIVLLAAEPGLERDWTKVKPRPGALFVVGDPKQSIYRFSGADIETYDRVKKIIERAGGQAVELTTSFRSRPSLCRWANSVFENPAFFPAQATREQPAFHPLAAVRATGDARTTGLRTLTVPATIEKSGEVAAANAKTIAHHIRASVDGGARKWGDFLILTWKKATLGVYAAALDELRIPVAVSGAVAFTKSREVAMLAGLLRTLADPDDGVALVGVLRGPLFGISDEELFRHREAGFGFILNAPIPEDATGQVVDALGTLRIMFKWTRTLPIPAAIERIFETTGLLARAAATTPGGAEAGNLLHALDRVRQITESGGSLAAAAEALEEDLDGSEIESVPLEPGRQDVVRVMNLHKAKGLEAPVVILADPTGGFEPRASVHVVRDGPRPLGYFQITKSNGDWDRTVLAEPIGWEDHEVAELAYLKAEQNRLLYVAATRAQDLLVISQWAKTGGKATRPWVAFEPALAGVRALAVAAEAPLPARELVDLCAEARRDADVARQARGAIACQPSWQVESVTAIAHHAEPYGHPLQEGRTREPDAGMAWGSLVHALLEHAMRGPARDRAHLQRVANWLTMANPDLRRVVPEALDTVEGVMASDLGAQAMAAEERQAEVPFAATVPGGDSPKLLYGVIDLAFRTSRGWELIDYKTDRLDMEKLCERYARQVEEYSTRWAAVTRESVGFAALYGVRSKALSPDLSRPGC